jgi:hypothetical protein
MRAGVVCAVCAGLLAAAAASSPPLKRYAFPAAAPAEVAAPAKLSVLLPAEWLVSTRWLWAANGKRPAESPHADDPVHRTVGWTVSADLEPPGTTLAAARRVWLRRLPAHPATWATWSTQVRVVGDTYLDVRAGRVWRYSLLSVPDDAGGGWAAREYTRVYVLDAGLAQATTTRVFRELFSVFTVRCRADQCRTHNRQFAAIIGSVRIGS